jgi:hypothetical protein
VQNSLEPLLRGSEPIQAWARGDLNPLRWVPAQFTFVNMGWNLRLLCPRSLADRHPPREPVGPARQRARNGPYERQERIAAEEHVQQIDTLTAVGVTAIEDRSDVPTAQVPSRLVDADGEPLTGGQPRDMFRARRHLHRLAAPSQSAGPWSVPRSGAQAALSHPAVVESRLGLHHHALTQRLHPWPYASKSPSVSDQTDRFDLSMAHIASRADTLTRKVAISAPVFGCLQRATISMLAVTANMKAARYARRRCPGDATRRRLEPAQHPDRRGQQAHRDHDGSDDDHRSVHRLRPSWLVAVLLAGATPPSGPERQALCVTSGHRDRRAAQVGHGPTVQPAGMGSVVVGAFGRATQSAVSS